MAKGNPAKRSTDATVQKRVNQIYDMLLMGVSRAQILEFALKQGWDVVDATVDIYISRANKRFAEQSKVVHAEQFGKAIDRLNNLYQKCMLIQDYKAALAVQKDMNQLLGLYAAKELKINVNIAIIQQLVEVATNKGYDPSTLFNDMIAELSQLEPIETSHDDND